MTSLKTLSISATSTVAIGITLITVSAPAAFAQSSTELQMQQNQQQIELLQQQLQMQQGGAPGMGPAPGMQPGMGTGPGMQPGVPPTGAAPIDGRSIQRSVNLAREAAVKLNGGLSKYRPAGCMFKGSERNPCIVQVNAQGIVFQIPGGPPGWEQEGQPPTVLTVLRVAPDGRSLLETISNGTPQTPPQQGGGQPGTPPAGPQGQPQPNVPGQPGPYQGQQQPYAPGQPGPYQGQQQPYAPGQPGPYQGQQGGYPEQPAPMY